MLVAKMVVSTDLMTFQAVVEMAPNTLSLEKYELLWKIR